ncbi:MAG: undecaprenyl/decaprenyl-phosphate alpha-N-acetylglucosaminyl 1-phosphate transferase [Gammaproteobacteria bacterium]|nr:undecaprenyl/decaprenyl-phosphate alpha-N-acetylglucosaminyl 1-phosphate transferase [Gammaproteobacteria bacterium]
MSLVISMLLVPPLIRLAPLIGAIDLPDARKVHSQAIPRIGGIAMIIGVMVPVLFWLPLDQKHLALLASFSVLLFFGIWDDRSDLHYRIKFLGQVLAVLIVVLGADVVVRNMPFLESPLPDYIAIPFTIFALVGITNAINLSDGLDGLAGGTTLLSFCMIAFIGFQSGNTQLVILCMAVAGAIMGFLRHNTYPARVFMGDTGSQFLGFSAGVLVVVLSQQVNVAMSPVIPLLLLGLPILDTFAVMAQRIYERRSPFSPDKNHIHHKLLALGFDHYEAVLVIYVVQCIFVGSAFALLYESDALIFSVYFLLSFAALFLFHRAMKTNWRVHRAAAADSRLRLGIKWLASTGMLEKVPTLLLKIGIPLFLIFSILVPKTIEQDIAMLALVLLVLFILFTMFMPVVTMAEKAVVYVVCVLAVYLLESSISYISEYTDVINIYMVILAIAFAVKVRFSATRTFQITPLDFLVVLLVLLVPNLPEFSTSEMPLGDSAFKLIVLFYSCEAVMNVVSKKLDVFRLGVSASLALIVVRGFL